MITSTVLTYIELFQNSTNREDIRLFLESDPHGPSVLSVLKTLKFAGINASAGRCVWEELKNLTSPFLLILNVGGKEFLVIARNNRKNSKLLIYNPTKKIWENKSKEDLLNVWNHVVIFTEKIPFKRAFKVVNFFVTTGCLSIIIVIACYNIALLPILIGAFISCYLSLKGKIININYIDRICHIASIANCDKVGDSPYSMVFGFKLNELATSFFLSQLLTVIIAIFLDAKADVFTLYTLPLVLFLPCLIYSVYCQFKLKQICPLCISVLIIMLWESLDYYIYMGHKPINSYILLLWIFFFALILGSLKTIYAILYKNELLRESRTRLLKLKRTKEILVYESQEIEDVSASIWLGNEHSTKVITTVISLQCTYCHKVMKNLIDMINSGYDFRWNIVFGRSSQHDSKIIKDLIGYYLINKKTFLIKLEEYLRIDSNCYILNKSNEYEYEINIIVTQFEEIIKSLHISSFPRIIFNKRLLSPIYESSDLKYLICD